MEQSAILSTFIKLPFCHLDLCFVCIFKWTLKTGFTVKLFLCSTQLSVIKVRKVAKIMNRYNQVPQLAQDTTWKSDKTQLNITNKSQKVSPFPQGSNEQTRKINSNTNDPQKKYGHGEKNILLDGLKWFHGANLTLSSDVDQDT